MRKERAFSIIVSSFLIWTLSNLPFVIIDKAQPQEAVIGIDVGDWARYENVLVEWNSTHMNPDPEFVELNNTLWFQNEVLDIEDTLIIFRQTTQFKNETQKPSMFQLDVNTGIGNGSLMFVSSGLSAFSLLYPASMGESPIWINETTTRTYAGATREVNHLNITDTQSTEDDPPNILHVSISHYWDKETGVLTERFGFGTYINQTGSQIASWTRSDRIIETNLWSPEEKPNGEQGEGVNPFQYAIVGVATVTMILIGVWLLWSRKRRLKKRKSRIRR